MALNLVDSLSGHSGRVWNVKWHPSGSVLASCGEDKNIYLWNKTGSHWKNKAILQEGHEKSIREVSWSPCGSLLASASFDGTTAIWENNAGNYECSATLEGHENEVKSVSWSSSGRFLSTCSRDKSVWIWEVDSDEYECAAVLKAHSQDVKKVIWHPYLDVVVSTSYDNSIKMFKIDPVDGEWTNFAALKSHESTVWSIAFDATGSRIASCSDDRTVRIWQEYLPLNPEGISTSDGDPSWKCVCTLSGYHSGAIYDVSWNKETGLIATACADNCIHIFSESPHSTKNEPFFELLCVKYSAHDQDVNSVCWNPNDSKLLSSCGDDSLVKIWTLN